MESSSKMIDQEAPVSHAIVLLRKQKFYVKMLAWLESACNLNRKEAKIQSKHLDQYHQEFISNQAEIFALSADPRSTHLPVRISQVVQQNMRQIQTKLEETISPTVPPSLLRKRKRYIDMIDSLEPTEDLNQKEAEVQSKHLDMFYRKFIANESEITALVEDDSSHDLVEISRDVQQKVRKIQTILDEIYSPSETVTSASNSLLRIRKYYIEMIDSLERTDNLNQTEAEIQSTHLDKYYDKFISNESEIIALQLVEEDLSLDVVEISHSVQQKVRKIQAKLNEIISPIKTTVTAPASSSGNEHSYLTKRPRVIVDLFELQLKKQKYLMEQIELIESKNDPNATEAETLLSHLSQLHDTFVENQSKIETYVSGTALDEQLQISGEVLRKVITLQMKLKEIFSPVMSLWKDVLSDGA